MYVYEHKLRPRYAETDQMGYVYYGNYAAFYEESRTEMLRHNGMTYRELEEMGVMMPVLEMHTKYIQPAKYDDLLTIKVILREKPSVRIKFEYEVYNEEGTLLNTGMTQLVFVDMERNRPCKPPQAFMDKIERHFT